MDYKSTLMYKEICQSPSVLAGLKEANANVMRRLVEEIHSKNIRVVSGAGRGTSDHALLLFKYLCEIYAGATVSLVACSVVTVYNGCIDFGGQLVIGVSQSGRALDVLEVLRRAKKQGAVTLSVTNNPSSPLATEADYHLYCNCGEEKSVAATKTFSAQCYLLAWLAVEMGKNSQISQLLNGVGEGLQAQLNQIEQSTDSLVKAVSNAEGGFILSRGLGYSLALEASLKLQETSYRGFKGYAFSDFQHGPMAMVGKGTPVIFIAPNAPYLEDLHSVADKMRGFGGDVYVVSPLVQASELEEFFGLAMFFQLLACRVSCANGNNPDSPRALSKVTITK